METSNKELSAHAATAAGQGHPQTEKPAELNAYRNDIPRELDGDAQSLNENQGNQRYELPGS